MYVKSLKRGEGFNSVPLTSPIYRQMKCSLELLRTFGQIHVFFISMVFFNLRLEYAYVFHKSSLKICLKYAYILKSKFHDLTYV